MLTPGIHNLGALYTSAEGYSYIPLWFEAEEGKEYHLTRDVMWKTVRVWIVDAGNGLPIERLSETGYFALPDKKCP